MISKAEARGAVQANLNSISENEYAKAAQRVYERLDNLLGGLPPTVSSILLYAANSKWREVPLDGLEHTYPERRFDYAPSHKNASFPAGHYDAIIVPLYGFTASGYRLGHGGGWYDKFLASQPDAIKIGAGLDIGGINFAIEPHDIAMDYIVTESECLQIL